MPARRTPWPIATVLLIGGALLALALALAIARARFLGSSIRATGTVSTVADEWMRDLNGRSLGSGVRVTASFRDRDGRTISVRSPVVSNLSSFRVGDAVRVDYPPGHPEQAVIATFSDRWLAPLIVGGIGAVGLLIGGLGLFIARSPGARIETGGATRFTMTTAPAADGDPTSSPPSTRRSDMRGATLPWILLGLVAAAALGFFAAWTMRGSGSGEAPANAAASVDPVATGTAPRAGYPSNLTVQAPPPIAVPSTPATPATPAATPADVSPDNGPALTGMARAFLAQADQDRAMQAALREKAARLPGLCPALSFVPGDTLVAAVPPPMFDRQGKLRRGLIRQRFAGVGCANARPLFNIWIFAADPMAPIKTVAGYMGATHADPPLQRDTTPIALAIAARLVPGCTALSVLDTRLPAGSPPPGRGAWNEQWLIGGCGRFVQLAVRFVPEANGTTRIEVPSTEARLIGRAG